MHLPSDCQVDPTVARMASPYTACPTRKLARSFRNVCPLGLRSASMGPSLTPRSGCCFTGSTCSTSSPSGMLTDGSPSRTPQNKRVPSGAFAICLKNAALNEIQKPQTHKSHRSNITRNLNTERLTWWRTHTLT